MASKQDTGGYQCGTVCHETDVDSDNAITCSCSRCQRTGCVLAMAPHETFTRLTGGDSLTGYLSGKKIIQRQFCKTWGSGSFDCAWKGSVLTMAARETFTRLTGGDSLAGYLSGKKIIQRQFCKTWGGGSFSYARTGFVQAMAPRETFTRLRGGDSLTGYLSGKKIIQRQFCKACGAGALPASGWALCRPLPRARHLPG
ncbi:hypothetical protein OKA06_19745 [Novosphingobium sp. MW5]|nr:hypothetical protein [Novosphingobium sp. MW5]